MGQNYIVIKPPASTGSEKFDSCIHKGEKTEREVKDCCGKKMASGYPCHKKNFFPLRESDCQACIEYESKS